MIGDVGPYMEMNGPRVWVPRTVPYLRARVIAKEAIQEYGQRIAYVGKTDSDLLGFTRDCLCDEVCALQTDRDDEPTGDTSCRVPAWAFEIVE